MKRILCVLVLLGCLPLAGAYDLTSIEISDAITLPSGALLVGPRADVTAVFDDTPDRDDVEFVFIGSGGSAPTQYAPSSCDSDSCTIGPIDFATMGFSGVYVRTGSDAWYADRLEVRTDTSGPELASLEVVTGDPSSISFDAHDESGDGSYRLMRGATTIAQGDSLSETIVLSESLDAGSEVRFALVLIDAFGNTNTETFGGVVPDDPISIDSISDTAYLDSRGDGLLSFEVSGEVAHASVSVEGSEYPASCNGSCSAIIESPASNEDVTVRIVDSFGSVTTRSRSVSFVEDTTAPVFERINTRYSGYDETTGYTDGSVFVEFRERANMYPEEVVVSIDGVRTTARSCSRDGELVRCAVPMSGSGVVEFRSARDAAGNEASVPDDAITRREIEVDTVPPQVRRFTLRYGSSVSDADTKHIDAPGELEAIFEVVSEGSEASRARITIRTSDETRTSEIELDCTMLTTDPSRARCLSDPFFIDETSRISFEVFDASGIPYRDERFVVIGESSEGFSGWDVLDVTTSPGYYLPEGRMPVTIEARVGSSIASSAVSVGGASLVSCTGIEGAFASANRHTIVITGFSDGPSLSSGSGSCTLDVTTVRTGTLDPEPETIEVEFSLDPIGSASIEDPLGHYEASEAIVRIDSALSTAGTIFDYASVACDVYEGLNLASVAVNAAATALGGDAQVSPIGQVLAAVGGGIFRAVDGVGDVADPLCAIVHCKIPLPGAEDGETFQDVVLEAYNAIEGDIRSDVNDLLGSEVISSGVSKSRVENSLVLSTITACIPGVVENAQKITQAQCAYDLCMLQVHTGDYAGTAAMCSYAHSMQMCSLIGDEVFAVVPYASVAGELSSEFASIVKQPLRLAAGWATDMLVDALADQFPSIRVVLGLDLASVIAMIAGPDGADASTAPPDHCSDLDDYLDELDDRGVFS